MPNLRQVYPIDDGDDAQTKIDIVAVHGLNPLDKQDHARSTWTKNGRFWLADDLGPDLGIARIFLFEYDSYPGGRDGHQRLVDSAEDLLLRIESRQDDDGPRPLIFIAHSLGGLLVKNAVVRAQGSSTYKPVIDALQGLIFFAVPHLGGDKLLSTLGDALFRVHKWPSKGAKSDFFDAIKPGSESSYNLKEYFMDHLSRLWVLSFYEGLPHSDVGRVIVDKESATFGVPQEKKTMIDADHSNICRFDTREKDGGDLDSYRMVRKHIRDAIRHIQDTPPNPSIVQPGTLYPGPPVFNDVFHQLPQRRRDDGSYAVGGSDATDGSDDGYIVVRKKRSRRLSNRSSASIPSYLSPSSPARRPRSHLQSPSTLRVPSLEKPYADANGEPRTGSEASREGTANKPYVFRISSFDSRLSPGDIRNRLEEMPYHLTHTSKANIKSFFHAPFDGSYQTVAVEFGHPPDCFPEDPRCEYELTDEGTGWWLQRMWGSRPKVDAHFQGLTPLSLSWSDEDRKQVGKGTSGSWITRWYGESEPSDFKRIRVDIIVLTPLPEHPYGYWRNENGSMWVADFLKDEGFDWARILVFGGAHADKGFAHQKTDLLHLLQSQNPKILVDLPKLGSEPFSSELLGDREGLPENAGIVLLSDRGHLSASKRIIRPSRDDHLDYSTDVRFANNRDRMYRWIVDSIWILVEKLLIDKQPMSQAGQAPYAKKARRKIEDHGPDQLLSELPGFLDVEAAISPLDGTPDEPGNDIHGILNDVHFKSWLDGSAPGAVQLVIPPRCDHKAFCDFLPSCKPKYKVVRLDCRRLTESYGPSGNYGKGSALIAPLLLWVSTLIIKAWGLSDARNRGALVSFLGGLFDAAYPSRTPKLTDLPAALTTVVEYFGSNLAGEAAKLIARLHDPTTATKIMIVVDLHGFLKSPERGRMVHCIYKFHSLLPQDLESRLLFLHDGDGALEGLLSHATLINDDEFQECLSSLNSNLPKRRNVDDRHQDTLKWFWQNEEYKRWRELDTSAILCLWGKPACGKSVLSQYVSNGANGGKEESQLEGKTCAAFFFQDRKPGMGGPRAMIQGVLCDILKHHGRSVFPCFQEEFLERKKESMKDKRRRLAENDGGYGRDFWDEESLEKVAEKLARQPIPETYVVIDGLDESEDPILCAKSLLKLFPPSKETGICLKLLVATRPSSGVRSCLEGPFDHLPGSICEITLQEKNQDDILQYTKSFLNESLTKRLGWDLEAVERARYMVLERSHGTFLWAKMASGLFGRFLESSPIISLGDFQRHLGTIPEKLEKLYKKLLGNLIHGLQSGPNPDGRNPLRATQIFRLAAQAHKRRPLSAEEFCDAFALLSYKDGTRGDNAGSLDLEQYRPPKFLDSIPSLTANLLEYYREANVVDFLHPTAVDFLSESEQKFQGTPMRLLMDEPRDLPATEAAPTSGPFAMGTVCIWYLEYVSSALERAACSALDGSRDEINLLAQALDGYPFLVYAMEHFRSHVCNKGNGNNEAIGLFTHMLNTPLGDLLQEWILNQVAKQKLPSTVTEEWKPIKEVRGFANSVLHCAAAEGLSTTARVALLAGAEVDSRSALHDFKENALCLTSIHYKGDSSAAVARVLLEAGADPNAETGVGGAPLHYAGKFMAEEVMRLLLRRGARVYARDRHGMTPLHRTVIGKRTTAENPAGEAGPWRRAPREANLACARMLVREGADVNASDDRGQKPIHWAAGIGDRLEFVEFLVQAQGSRRLEAAVNTECAYQRLTPLLWASGYGNLDVVRYLTDRGARINYVDGRGKNAANWAARYGHADILDTLIQKLGCEGGNIEAFVNQEEPSGRTPLIWACLFGHYECVRRLVSAGATVDQVELSQNGMRSTPLSWAVSRDDGGLNYRAIIHFLVENGASIPSNSSRPLIGWAASKGNNEGIHYLLDKARERSVYLDLDDEDSWGRTPFMLAASNGHVKTIETLRSLQKFQPGRLGSINFHQEDRWKNTALLLAAGWGHLNSVKWLVETARLDVNHTNEDGDTALHRAKAYGRKSVEDYLLSRGARRDIKNRQSMAWDDARRERRGGEGYEQYVEDQEAISQLGDLEDIE